MAKIQNKFFTKWLVLDKSNLKSEFRSAPRTKSRLEKTRKTFPNYLDCTFSSTPNSYFKRIKKS